MKFFNALSAAALLTLVSAAPTPEEPSHFELDVPVPASFPSVEGVPSVVEGNEVKRDVEGGVTDIGIAALYVDVWQNADRGGRHEALWSELNKCCK